MWQWLAKRLSRQHKTEPGHSGDLLVPDEEYEFKVGTQPITPDGLRDLKITELRDGLLLLERFDADLTVAQSYHDRTPLDIHEAVNTLRWAASDHRLDAGTQLPVRLHCGNLLLSASHYSALNSPEGDIAVWLEHMGWDTNRQCVLQIAITDNPLEDGFFTCARVTVGNVGGEKLSGLPWKPHECRSSSVVSLLADFVRQECKRPWGTKCERFLQDHYSRLSPEQLKHPVFALLDFPVFDMGMVRLTFAATVCSPWEVRFWSRPTFFHK